MFHLFPAVNKLRLQACIPVEGDPFKGSNKLLYQPISLSASIAARLNEVSNVLFGFAHTIKLVEFRGLVTMGHTKGINPFRIRLYVQMGLARSSPQLSLNSIVIRL